MQKVLPVFFKKALALVVCSLLSLSLLPSFGEMKAWGSGYGDESHSIIFWNCWDDYELSAEDPDWEYEGANGVDIYSTAEITDVTVISGSVTITKKVTSTCQGSPKYSWGSQAKSLPGDVEGDVADYMVYPFEFKSVSNDDVYCLEIQFADGSTMTFGSESAGGGVFTAASGDDSGTTVEKTIPTITQQNYTFQMIAKPSTTTNMSVSYLFTAKTDGAVSVEIDGKEENLNQDDGNPFELYCMPLSNSDGSTTYRYYISSYNWINSPVGTHTVSVSCEEGESYAAQTAEFTVEVTKADSGSLTVSGEGTTIELGDTKNFVLSLDSFSDGNGNAQRDLSTVVPEFAYNNEGIVEISCASVADGMTVKALAVGTVKVTITIPADDIFTATSATLNLTVEEGDTEYLTPSLSGKTSYTLAVGGEAAQLEYTGDGTLSVSSSDSEVVEATKSGSTITLTPMAEGSATVTVSATMGDEYAALDAVTISVVVEAEGTEVEDPNDTSDDKEVVQLAASVEAGKSGTITNDGDTLFLYDAENQAVNSGEASSADESIATAEYSDGVLTITGVAEGTTTITVSSDEAATTAEVEVTVTAATSFTLNANSTGVVVTQPTGGDNVPTSAEIVVDVTELASGDDDYDTLKNDWVAETLLGVYDVTMTVNGEEVSDGFGTVTISFPVSGDYEYVYVYHLHDDGTVEKSIALPVTDGVATIEVDSLSTFAVSVADDDSTTTSSDSSDSDDADSSDDASKTSTGLSKTGDTALYLIGGALAAFAVCAVVAGGFANGLRRRSSGAGAHTSDE